MCDQWIRILIGHFYGHELLLNMGNSQASSATSVRDLSDKDLSRIKEHDDEYA